MSLSGVLKQCPFKFQYGRIRAETYVQACRIKSEIPDRFSCDILKIAREPFISCVCFVTYLSINRKFRMMNMSIINLFMMEANYLFLVL